MASRIALGSLKTAVSTARPRAVVIPRVLAARSMSTQTPPQERATELINKLPSSPSLITKTGTAVVGSAAIAAAISNELYVVNEETIVLVGFAILITLAARALRQPYSEWAEGHIQNIKNILNRSRSEHTQAVKDRIVAVEQMKDVESITEGLFALSKETAKLEHDTFVQRQHVALAAELKGVLDSWVRFEQQQKESEQQQLAQSVIDKVLKTLTEKRTQDEILSNSIAELEQLVKSKAI